jgi:NAD-dependent SIR2 family protein deacetylase
MGLKKLAAKVADYNERLESGLADEIKPDHVHKVLEKLQRKEKELQEEISSTNNADKKERLERKLGVAREQIARARWLLETIG